MCRDDRTVVLDYTAGIQSSFKPLSIFNSFGIYVNVILHSTHSKELGAILETVETSSLSTFLVAR